MIRAMILRTWAVLGALLVLSACGGQDDTAAGPLAYSYPLDDVLRLNQLQAKGTHNSYHVAPDQTDIVEHRYTHAPIAEQLSKQGVRKFELDTRYDDQTGEHVVFHLGIIDKETRCLRFVECLEAMRGWSKKYPGHHPLFVMIEPKDGVPLDAEGRFALIEQEVLSVFPRPSILTPDDVRGAASTLRDALTTVGWPTLGEVRGKVIFFLNDAGKYRDAYTRGGTNLDGRLFFAEATPGVPYEAFYVLNDPISGAASIQAAVDGGFIVRTRADAASVEPLAGDTARRDAAFASGAQLVSTDYPAPVEGVSYFVDVPGGTPSRCNPRVAPADCTSESVEDPRFVR